ncbi:MAG: YraN family protein [Gammaproteobacteria bacterium]|jgi:putative endonuclease|nr:YraN family protein [Gammaproteobacteria bacterium]
MRSRESGDGGEARAEAFLAERGLRLVERNYSCRSGEIDLVMLDPTPPDTEVLAFVEVRLRGPGARVDAFDSVDPRKQQRLVSAARHFLMCRDEWQDHACRFDVVGIDGEDGNLRWIAGAFELAG